MTAPQMSVNKRAAHFWAFLLSLALAGLSYLLSFSLIGHLGLLLFLAVFVFSAGRLYRYVERH